VSATGREEGNERSKRAHLQAGEGVRSGLDDKDHAENDEGDIDNERKEELAAETHNDLEDNEKSLENEVEGGHRC
jgi:hypothetical protein